LAIQYTARSSPPEPHLTNYKREVLDDGVVGNELAIALFLAVGHRPPVRARIY
jgi:hypothetical protein